MEKQENLKRIQNYPNGTKLIIQLECENEDIWKLNNKISTKYGQNFLDADFFTYVPDLRKLGYTDITED